MYVKGAGVALHASETVGNVDSLRRKLEVIERLGFECVELPIQGMKTIRDGRVDETRLDSYRQALSGTGLKVTTHAPFNVNLLRQEDAEVDFRCLLAALDVSGAIGAETMTLHPSCFVGEEEFLYPRRKALPSGAEKEEALAAERELMRAAGDRAAQRGVKIGMENMRPYLDCPEYSYAVRPSALAEQVARIAHPNVGVTLDTGHAYLAQRLFRLDLDAELRALQPHIVHIHAHDNFGRPNYSTEKNQYELYNLGRGDMHMPIGDGDAPLAHMLGVLPETLDGYLIHEVREMYEGDWPSIGARMARFGIRKSEGNRVPQAGV